MKRLEVSPLDDYQFPFDRDDLALSSADYKSYPVRANNTVGRLMRQAPRLQKSPLMRFYPVEISKVHSLLSSQEYAERLEGHMRFVNFIGMFAVMADEELFDKWGGYRDINVNSDTVLLDLAWPDRHRVHIHADAVLEEVPSLASQVKRGEASAWYELDHAFFEAHIPGSATSTFPASFETMTGQELDIDQYVTLVPYLKF